MIPLEPAEAELRELGAAAIGFLASFLAELPERPAINPAGFTGEVGITEQARPMAELLEVISAAADPGIETAGPRYLGYIPGGGLVSSAIAGLITLGLNRYATVAEVAPGMVAIEDSVLRWLCAEFGLPDGSGGLLTTGGSLATLSAVVAARELTAGEPGALYVSAHTHVCVAKAARIAGLPVESIRVVPVDEELRMDAAAAARMIAEDRRAGRNPFLIAASAGTTDTGAVDPLPELAELARREGLWLHVDAAYGGAFQLTARGRDRLAGIELADSITLDPHKGLFLPYGVGALLVRDVRTLARAHQAEAAYLRDLQQTDGLPDYLHLGPEMSREHRGLRVWLPLKLHGVQAFRAALDEKLDLADQAWKLLSEDPELDLPWRPALSTVVFRVRSGDAATGALFNRIRDHGRILLTSTRIRGRLYLRLCVLSHRTHLEHILDAVREIRDQLAAQQGGV